MVDQKEEMLQAKFGPHLKMWRGRRSVIPLTNPMRFKVQFQKFSPHMFREESAVTIALRQPLVKRNFYNLSFHSGNNLIPGIPGIATCNTQFTYTLNATNCDQVIILFHQNFSSR